MNTKSASTAQCAEYYLVGLLDTVDQNKWDTEIGWPIFRSDHQA